MAVKNGSMFGQGFSNDIQHDVFTGKMLRNSVITGPLKALRAKYNLETTASMKDESSALIRKELADQGISPIDSVFGKFTGIKVNVRTAGEGEMREAKVHLTDPDTGEIDTVVLNLSTGSGQMAIHKLAQIEPGEEIELKLFSLIVSKNEDGTPKLDEKGSPVSFVNHIGVIQRADGTKIVLDKDPVIGKLIEDVKARTEELTKMKLDRKTIGSATSSMRITSAVDCARRIEVKMKASSHSVPDASEQPQVNHDDAVFNGDDGFEDNSGSKKSHKP
jgi:hypothetical protein